MKSYISYITLPNNIFDLDLTVNELAVYTYLCTIHSTIKGKNGMWLRVKQATIARKCGFKTTQTVSRIISSLMRKGFISQSARLIKRDHTGGTYCYILEKPPVTGGFFRVERYVFDGIMSPKQLRVYLFMCRSICDKIGYSWNSYNDIAKQLQMKRSDVVKIIKELVALKTIRKQAVKMRSNKRVFADNRYFIIKRVRHSGIKKSTRKELRLHSSQKHSPKIIISVISDTNHNALTKNYNPLPKICQVFSLSSRGSPQKRNSYILPKYILQKRE